MRTSMGTYCQLFAFLFVSACGQSYSLDKGAATPDPFGGADTGSTTDGNTTGSTNGDTTGSTNGDSTSGGSSNTGGSSTGGSSTAGTSTGGNSTGGSSTGGNSTGGTSAGGSSTGGSSTGGSSSSSGPLACQEPGQVQVQHGGDANGCCNTKDNANFVYNMGNPSEAYCESNSVRRRCTEQGLSHMPGANAGWTANYLLFIQQLFRTCGGLDNAKQTSATIQQIIDQNKLHQYDYVYAGATDAVNQYMSSLGDIVAIEDVATNKSATPASCFPKSIAPDRLNDQAEYELLDVKNISAELCQTIPKGCQAVGICSVGCYARGETLGFAGSALTVETLSDIVSKKSADDKQEMIVGVDPKSQLGDLRTVEVPVSYTVADKNARVQPMIDITVAVPAPERKNYHTKVTLTHVLVDGDGRWIRAGAVKVGTLLLMEDGKAHAVTAVRHSSPSDAPVQTFNFGLNISDLSQHLILSEGFLDGSHQIQTLGTLPKNRVYMREFLPDAVVKGSAK